MKLAYGSIKKIQDAIDSGTIKAGTLIITSDEDNAGELFFYDNEGNLKRVEKKTKFTSYTDAVNWAKVWGSCGDIISIRGNDGKWSPYFVDENLQISVLSSGSGNTGGVLYGNDILEFPEIGENGRIYIDTKSRALYIWDNENFKYVMVGCDYNNAILNGGNAYAKDN